MPSQTGGDDEPVDLAVDQCLELGTFPVVVVVGVRQQSRVALNAEYLFDPSDDWGKRGLVRSGRSTPTVNERLVRRLRATAFGV